MDLFLTVIILMAILFTAMVIKQVYDEHQAKEEIVYVDEQGNELLLEKNHEGSIRHIDNWGNTLEWRFSSNFSEKEDRKYEQWAKAFDQANYLD